MDVDVERITDELYGLRPSEFTAARDAYAAEARQAKDKEAAKAIAALRRPPLAVWAANLLARERPEEAERFLALGEALREAHRTLDGERLREASRRQHRLVAALVRTAAGLAEAAGQPLSDTVLGEVERVLHAVLAHPDVAGPWSRGSLTALPETTVGFPEVPPDVLPRPPATAPDRTAREARASRKAHEAREAERARAVVARRERERDAAREAAAAAKTAAEEAARRLRRAEREREEARTAAAATERTATEAETALRAAESVLDEARRAAEPTD
ncbi:hypothetical protein HHL19_29090 [Streptomyces sp. R302]|uniref:hypothetical protein n=1 Tax=unclassified Streptomyces TaxID=2593676 RepID=UPI00145E3CBC|nr:MULTISPECIES: hypothetical protein [unclassified Streptomyces]NML54599.1 hypothetical protein [Streptomyces sp. R301]NML82604.1 hypothetical protein [Streptomyces sp. R302]